MGKKHNGCPAALPVTFSKRINKFSRWPGMRVRNQMAWLGSGDAGQSHPRHPDRNHFYCRSARGHTIVTGPRTSSRFARPVTLVSKQVSKSVSSLIGHLAILHGETTDSRQLENVGNFYRLRINSDLAQP